MRTKTLIIVFVMFLTPFSLVFSQNFATEPTFQIVVNPENPRPNEDVVITLNSFSFDISKAVIKWSKGEEILKSGIGATTFSLKTGSIGTQENIDVSVFLLNTEIVRKTIVIRPASVDMMWQAIDSYVPPFYKGKALPTPEARIKVVALPNAIGRDGSNVDYDKMIYTWRHNYATDLLESGYQKNSYIYFNDILEDSDTVQVEVKSSDDSFAGSNITTIKANQNAILRLYEKDPLEGIFYNKSSNKISLDEREEILVVAEPFYMSPFDPTMPEIEYTWKLNGNVIPNPTLTTELLLRKAEERGTATIEVEIKNTSRLLQSLKDSIQIEL